MERIYFNNTLNPYILLLPQFTTVFTFETALLSHSDDYYHYYCFYYHYHYYFQCCFTFSEHSLTESGFSKKGCSVCNRFIALLCVWPCIFPPCQTRNTCQFFCLITIVFDLKKRKQVMLMLLLILFINFTTQWSFKNGIYI